VAINTGRVISGGLAAGVVLNVIDFVSNMLLGDRMKAEMSAVSSSLAEAMQTASATVTFVVIDFLFGILLVWLYAAIRPRFGLGSGTATRAGIFVWFLAGLVWYSYVVSGLATAGTFAILAVIGLVNMVVAANVGAMIYKEV
jgi:hypothetical protein